MCPSTEEVSKRNTLVAFENSRDGRAEPFRIRVLIVSNGVKKRRRRGRHKEGVACEEFAVKAH
ncbi:hypothetical protein E2C01_086580 [Portunus trituberculatus]|uniref:Uncharacterized protein n=1 Tax=Portunus trituberculatus TaxID=210409 RepID=A0A5B7JA32_PORTR|nr:hypothetical protein [Portunus trituberculatus]